MVDDWSRSYHGQLRALAGDRTLLLTGVRVVVRDASGRVLLIRRRDNGHWAMPAGAMELGESITACAVRELREETGLHAGGVTLFGLHTGGEYTRRNAYGDTYQHFAVMFRVDSWSGDLARTTDETTGAGFFFDTALPQPLAGSVTESLADLAHFEATGTLVLK
jgi:ADP-ribose pyrophosphatase YjhB (NUDIX family)